MPDYGQAVTWTPERPRLKPVRLVLSWFFTAVSLWVAALVLPGVDIADTVGAFVMAACVAVLNAVLPPLVAALRLPFTVGLGFVLVLVLNALVLQISSSIVESYTVDNFGWALLAALLVSAVSVVLEVIFGANDDHTYSLAVVRRVARRQGGGERTDVPGIVYLEIDGLALPVLRRAMRDGNAPNMARWLAESTHSLAEWETDLSSQTGASQAGILLGSNEEIPAFRWVEKETATVVACSAPDDCARIEQARLEGNTGLLADGGSSRGNLLSGGADEVILTVSRLEAEKKANPGYRAFFANGFNVTRSLVLFGWEVILEWVAANRASRRDVRPRGHRGGLYPFIRAAMCVVVRDLIVYGVLTDMMRGRPAVYATFSSYDEVAHHSGLERADTLEALRKVDQQFGQIDQARRFAPRPYAIVVLSDHGQTQGATFKQRNGYGLDELVARSLESGRVQELAGGDEQRAMVGHAIGEATGAKADKKKRSKTDVSDREVVVLGSGNLGLVYLMEERRRLTLEEIEQRHPRLVQALRAHPHVGWILVRSSEHGAVALGGRRRSTTSRRAGWKGRIRSRASRRTPRGTCCAPTGSRTSPTSWSGASSTPDLEEGCAFEELISFHGGLGGPQTRAFILHPVELELPEEPLVGAAAVHQVLARWRRQLHGVERAGELAAR